MTASAARRRAPSAAELATHVDALREQPGAAADLAGLLAEQSPFFAGRGANEAQRLRGYVLASFETVGLPPDAVPFVLEELETGRNPYTVAAAARALRGVHQLPEEAPALLVRAIARLRDADEVVSFDGFAPARAGENAVTAVTELVRTLALLGPRAAAALPELQALVDGEGELFPRAVRAELDGALEALARPGAPGHSGCCGGDSVEIDAASRGGRVAAMPAMALADLALEDQDGVRLTFSEAFSGRPTALAFFYTRCTNPEKCSLTVTRLGGLARRACAEGLDANVAGITYDPRFDRPARLRAYGADRGMSFSSRCALLRTVGPFEPVREAFDLGVGFGPVTVNRHRLDLVVLDASMAVARTFERRLWHEEAALDALRTAATAPAPAGGVEDAVRIDRGRVEPLGRRAPPTYGVDHAPGSPPADPGRTRSKRVSPGV